MHATADIGPFARRRQDAVARALDCELVLHPGVAAVDDLTEVRTKQGKPYTVFSPFHRNWLEQPRRELLGAPRTLPPLPSAVRKGGIPSLGSLGLEQEVEDPLPGGERAGRERLSCFVSDGVGEYTDNHDALGRDKTSRLSPYLHFGCLSPRELEERLPGGQGSRRLPAPALLARLLHARAAPLPPERPLGVPGALPGQHQLELRREGLRRLVPGPHRVPAGGRGHAPAAA